MKVVQPSWSQGASRGTSLHRAAPLPRCARGSWAFSVQGNQQPYQQPPQPQQQQQQQKQQKGKKKGDGGLLASVLSLSAAPYSSYVPQPKTFLHHASAEAKQLWMVGVLLVMARASPTMRVVIVVLLALATMAALPRRLWEPQLKRLGGLCAILFVFTALGSDGVPPVLVDRSLPTAASVAATGKGAAAAASAAAAAAASAAAEQLSSSMAGLAGTYRYVLLKLGPLTVTRKGLNLAVALTGLTFTALQSASLCLVTTPPERMAEAVGRALSPLRWVGVPVSELVLTVLLALRFMGTVFEECRNLCLGLASRGIKWGLLGAREVLSILLGMATKLFSNLMARCDNIAVAMCARGFAGPERHALRLGAPRERPGWADVGVVASLLLLLGLSYVLV